MFQVCIGEIIIDLHNFFTEKFFSIEFLTFIAVLVALVTPFIMHWLERRPKESALEIGEKGFITLQVTKASNNGNDRKTIGRVSIKNFGVHKAIAVQAFLEEVKNDGKIRGNFIPVPLCWTHQGLGGDGLSLRDIHPNQTVLLDIFYFEHPSSQQAEGSLNFALAIGSGIENFAEIKSEKTELSLKLYQESGQVIPFRLLIKWPRNGDIKKGGVRLLRPNPPQLIVL